jgi:putative spermidine/putrescine transport system substrate-binding protein
MVGISRRSLLAAGLAVPAVAGLDARRALAQAAPLRIGTWGGSWREAMDAHVISKLKPLGTPIEYVLGNPDDNLAKLVVAKRQGQIPFDVWECKPDEAAGLVKANLLEPLDYAKVPNAAALPAWARAPQHVFTIATQDGIVYNEQKFREAGLAPPTRYLDLNAPALRGRVAFPDVSNTLHWNAVFGLAYEDGKDESDMSSVIRIVKEMKPAYYFSSSVDLALKFGSGEIWAAPWQTGWAVRLKRSGVPAAIGWTKFGDHRGALQFNAAAAVRGTPNPDGAFAFIDAYLSPDGQLGFCKATGVMPMHPAARRKMAEDPELAAMMLLDDAAVEQAFRVDWTRFNLQKWRERWTREIGA